MDVENRMVLDWEWDDYEEANEGYDERAEDEAINRFYGAED